MLLASNIEASPLALGFARWGKIQEVNKAAGRVGERVGPALLRLGSCPSRWSGLVERTSWLGDQFLRWKLCLGSS